MARVTIEAAVFGSDSRFDRLALELGVTRDHAVGAMARVWLECTERGTDVLPKQNVDLLQRDLKQCFTDAGIRAELFDDLGDNVRVRGCTGRIEWLKQKREAGRKGGVRSGESRRNSSEAKSRSASKQNAIPLKRKTNPPAPAPAPARKSPPSPPAGGQSPGGDGAGKARAKRSDLRLRAFRPHALDVLSHIARRTGVKYRGADRHVKLIRDRCDDMIREGKTLDAAKIDLRKIIAYCWGQEGLNWQSSPDRAQYLRPETLFGPDGIERYLDAARHCYPDRNDDDAEGAA